MTGVAVAHCVPALRRFLNCSYRSWGARAPLHATRAVPGAGDDPASCRRRSRRDDADGAAATGLRGFPALGYYAATKFAVEGLTDVLRKELAPLGISTLLVEPGPFRTDWAGRSAHETLPERETADYAATASAQRATFRGETGRQPGDPRRAARAIIAALKREPAPQRLVLGAMAYDMAIDQLESMLAEMRENEMLTRSADYIADDS
jgi:NAD(P)-dependent dehydrogenase (short-subunit alcohol dehydrogenase family)